MDVNEIGTSARNGKYISKHATYRSIRKGGAGQMHLAAHIKAIHASWIFRYLHPREAQWKQVLDEWIGVPRYALLHALPGQQRKILKRVPTEHHLISQALRAFWNLKLTLSESCIRLHGHPDIIRSIPLAYNGLFKLPILTISHVREAGIERIDNLFDEKNKLHTWAHLWDMVNNVVTRNGPHIRTMVRDSQTQIPKMMISLMRTKRSWDPPYICEWSDPEGSPIYGVAEGDNLHELHLNDSGIGTPVSTPHNLKERDCDIHLQKVSLWGTLRKPMSPPPIIGYACESYPCELR
eukprot:4786175-Pleurochrysis_carterae.AAC.1